VEVLIKRPPLRQRKSIPFFRRLEKTNRILDDATKNEWVDDVERRLNEVLSRVNPEPMIRGYSVERSGDGLTLYTITARKVGKREIGLLSAGDWPDWDEIVRAVPEFDLTQIVFDAMSRFEWSRRWDMRVQEARIQFEHGFCA
jgi:hypothetical protein